MTAERIRALDGIGFDWGTSKTEWTSTWSERFEQLLEFKLQLGHCLVPPGYAANPMLAKWVSTQRSRYRKNTEEKPNSMTAERIQALDGIGFDWGTSKTKVAPTWSERFAQLLGCKVQFGHCLVPQKNAATPKLGQWVATQRSNCRKYQEGKPSCITEDRIRTLDGIGFDWGRSKTDLASVWIVRFRELCEFKAHVGHCLVPHNYPAHLKLGHWVNAQRCSYKLYQEGKASRMSEEQMQALDGVGFDWGRSKTDWASVIWSERFRELCEFKAQFGHCLVAQNYPDNLKLGSWVSNQRARFREFQEGKPNPMRAEHI